MPNGDNGNHKDIKDSIGQLNPEDQKALLAEVVKNLFSPQVRKDIASEATQALPDQLQKDAATEATQSLSDGAKKDVVTEATHTLPPEAKKEVASEATQSLPTEAKKEVATEATQSLPPEVKKDLVTKAVQTLPMEDKKDIAFRTFQDLSAKDQQDVAGNPSQHVTDQIWLTIVRTFAGVLALSGVALLYVSIWPPQGEANPTQVMLPVFTSIAGILAGFISGRASAGG